MLMNIKHGTRREKNISIKIYTHNKNLLSSLWPTRNITAYCYVLVYVKKCTTIFKGLGLQQVDCVLFKILKRRNSTPTSQLSTWTRTAE